MPSGEDGARFSRIFEGQYDFIWRSLRRLGVLESSVDDAAQEVFVIASRKLDLIEPGKDRSYLFGIAIRVASDARRSLARRREAAGDPNQTIEQTPCDIPLPSHLLEQKQARALLDEAIDALSEELRVVFVLFELEGMTMVEISECLTIPQGTVASRLRRARVIFQNVVQKIRVRIGGDNV